MTEPGGSATDSGSAVALRNIEVTFGGDKESFTAVHSVDLDIELREFVTIIGPSGCGKSTLLRVIADLLPASHGTAVVLGRTPEESRIRRAARDVLRAWPGRGVGKRAGTPLAHEQVDA